MQLAEQLVGEARERRADRMPRRERRVLTISAALYLAVAVALVAFLPSERTADPLLLCGLVCGYALVSRVRFEFGDSFVVPELLAYVPLLLLAPLPWVPVLVGVAAVLAMVPDFLDRTWHRDRWIGCVSDNWSLVPPVLVLAAFAPGDPSLDLAWVYALALGAELVVDLGWTALRNQLLDRVPVKEMLSSFKGTATVDCVLAPLAFVMTIPAAKEPLALLVLAPLLWLFDFFSRERQARYSKTLELHRAYRGTVALLSDVVEHEDAYTASHSRTIAELVHPVADELGMDRNEKLQLEFAALLHDIGKIAIPKEVLHKPAKLAPAEYELLKTHTIEGQFMLDRVGGLLGEVGEVVRSCHERWDGKGYPDGLKGEEIPLAARIVFCCDAYNAMTTDRTYRPGMPHEAAVAELIAHRGTQFDPAVVDTLIKVLEQPEPVIAAGRIPVPEPQRALAPSIRAGIG